MARPSSGWRRGDQGGGRRQAGLARALLQGRLGGAGRQALARSRASAISGSRAAGHRLLADGDRVLAAAAPLRNSP